MSRRPSSRHARVLPKRSVRRTRNRRQTAPIWKRVSLTGLLRRLVPLLKRGTPLWIAALVLGVVITSGIFGYQWLTTSPRFAVREFVVRGAGEEQQRISQVLESARGENVFSVDLAGLEDAIGKLPAIRRARVRRELPNKVIVDVGTHEAAGIVFLGSLYLVDAEGTAFKRAPLSAAASQSQPIITGLSRDAYIESSVQSKAIIRKALSLSRLYAIDETRPPLSEVFYDERTGFSLVTFDSGTRIRVGDADPKVLEERLRAFDAAWAALDAKKRSEASTIYVDNEMRPERVIVAFAQAR